MGGSSDFSVMDLNVEIKEDRFIRWWLHFPLKFTKRKGVFELKMVAIIEMKRIPDHKDIVDKTSVIDDVRVKLRKQRGLFMDAIVYQGEDWCNRGAHCCTTELVIVQVTKFEDVMCHDN